MAWVILSSTVPTSPLMISPLPDDDKTSDLASSAMIEEEPSAFEILAKNMALCMVQSDLKRESGLDGSSTGWTSWIDEASAFRLSKCIDKLCLAENSDNDSLIQWKRWLNSSPSPMIIELSESLREAVNQTLSEQDLERVGQSHDEFLSRLACRVVVLSSGTTLSTNLQTAPGAMVYGKLLYGGVTRYRVLSSTSSRGRVRRAGERTVICAAQNSNSASAPSDTSWLQYGGPERNYQSVDMGPCALVEFILLPYGIEEPLLTHSQQDQEDMTLVQPKHLEPNGWFQFVPEQVPQNATEANITATTSPISDTDLLDASETSYIEGLESTFTSVVGGLRSEVEAIVRRVLDGRAMTLQSGDAELRAKDLQLLLDLGLSPVRGLLLYGPPGCGKTALARELSKLLTDRPPKIAAAPELLDRWVGGSEKLVRDLFGDAEAELKACGGDVTKSGLHVVVIDEVDAVFRKRTSAEDSGEVARASAVNQILAKLDGVNQLGNILVIGTTNRKELLDDALLRPGRLEVQIKVPLPDRTGRREIFNIHFDALRRRGRLSKPLCQAIDGNMSDETNEISWRQRIPSLRRRGTGGTRGTRFVKDICADRYTKGFSGADIEGLVRAAGSIALARARSDGSGVEGLVVTLEDVLQGLEEVRQ